MPAPVNLGVVGIHNFSRVHLKQFLGLREAGLVGRLAAVAHQPELDPAWVAQLGAQHVTLVPDLTTLLDQPGLDLVSLPVGIHLHVPMAEQVLARGIRVYLEKPVSGSLAEVDRLMAHPRADLVQIGFQHLAMPSLRALRQRISAGEFGALKRAVVTCGWPRGNAYYARNRWAGQVQIGESIIRDSPANNACAHHLNLALFLSGGSVTKVTAALGRGNAITSFDTCGVRVALDHGASVVFNASHLGEAQLGVRLRLEFANTSLSCDDLDGNPTWRFADGTALEIGNEPNNWAYRHAVQRCQGLDVPTCTLAEARPHAAVIEAIHHHSIRDFSDVVRGTERNHHPAVDAALNEAHARGVSLAETALFAEALSAAS
jgi:predicted dehydrogenase